MDKSFTENIFVKLISLSVWANPKQDEKVYVIAEPYLLQNIYWAAIVKNSSLHALSVKYVQSFSLWWAFFLVVIAGNLFFWFTKLLL